jgi:hypothetical protein
MIDNDNNDKTTCTHDFEFDCDSADVWKNELTPSLVDAIALYIAGTPDPCEVTDALTAALLAGGMTHTEITLAVERFLPKEKNNLSSHTT